MKKIILPYTHLHFIGICGISMSSLAEICALDGYTVSGSDVAASSSRERALLNAGIQVFHGNSPDNLPKEVPERDVAVIFSAAIKADDPELVEAEKRKINTFSRAKFMTLMSAGIPRRIGISGMHGKSTVCAMLAQIFRAAGAEPDVICGADIPWAGGAFINGGGDELIFEACEYKDSFLSMRPTLATVTNIEAEHLDYFGAIEPIRDSFYRYASRADSCVINVDSPEARSLADRLMHDNCHGEPYRTVTCSVSDNTADYYATEISFDRGAAAFGFAERGKGLCHPRLKVIGMHNLSNAVTAAATAITAGIHPEYVEKGLSEYGGISRRMEYRGTLNGAVILDDYAHHPTEIKATLAAVREMGFRFISCAFQPHTYSRTASFFCDFVNAFSDADEVVFADIYAAREKNDYGVTAHDLANATQNGHYLPTPRLIAEHFRNIAAPGVLLLTMGAGELNTVADILIGQE
ncbi:MAG: UDP-N-acetylmuramate--L-alanine ligase [Clostridia bacterium]|nr:UDP-N-acetylmuramate--L-alanine ligase [Clostridia bacterium]